MSSPGKRPQDEIIEQLAEGKRCRVVDGLCAGNAGADVRWPGRREVSE